MMIGYPRLKRLFQLVTPYLEKNDFGVGHTKRVLAMAQQLSIPMTDEELVFTTIIVHDIGGPSIKEQYEQGPHIAQKLLTSLEYDENIIEDICNILRTHHDRPKTPSKPFMIVYDADQLVKFSKEEFKMYHGLNTNWNDIINNLYHTRSKELANKLLRKALRPNTFK